MLKGGSALDSNATMAAVREEVLRRGWIDIAFSVWRLLHMIMRLGVT